MKTIILSLISLFFACCSFGQQANRIETLSIGIGSQKTTTLVFPYPIVSGDRGSREIITQRVGGVDNMLLLKSTKDDFSETNLSVVTSDGSLYSFLVSPSKYPELSIDVAAAIPSGNRLGKITDGGSGDALLLERCALSAVKQPFLNKKAKGNDISFVLKGIYISNDVLFFQLALRNDSQIPYDISQLRYFVKDKKQTKRTAEQEIEHIPVYHVGNIERIEAGSEHTIAVALPKFTIPDKKKLVIQLQEKNGGRNLTINLNNRLLGKARNLP